MERNQIKVFELDKIDDIELYIVEYTNGLMEAVGDEPIYYLRLQFRNTITGDVELFKKRVFNKRKLKGEKLRKWLIKTLLNYANGRLGLGYYELIRFEDAKFNFEKVRGKKKKIATKAVAFYNEQEKYNDRFYTKLKLERLKGM